MELKNLNTQERPSWCPGCGNFGIWNSVKRAFVELGIKQEELIIVGGVGCSGKIPHWVKTFGFHGLHGRTLPIATGIKLANNKLTVIAAGGDGDGYDEGMSHFIHAARRNINITYIVHNNQVFGLTKGQTSPTADPGYKSATSPWGAKEKPINPIASALAAHATFVARGYAADIPHLTEILLAALKHKGFALVDIMQPCVTFNKINTYEWYRERAYKIGPNEKGKGKHNPSDIKAAFEKSQEWEERMPIGIFYQEERESFDDMFPQIKKRPLVDKDISNIDITKLTKKLF